MNNHASLTNEFVQQPQAAFTLPEIRLFNASLCCLHRKTASIATTFYIKVKDVASTGSAGYKALAEAIHTLKERRWFNKPLYSVLQQVKNEGVIEVRFNAELQEHLLHADAYYTTINVAALQEAGINHALSLRLLWILRSYYRPLAKVKEKYLTISELEALLFDGKSLGSYRQLKQLIDAAVKHLSRAGIAFTATTKKRGLVAKGITFTIPAITLKKAKNTVKERVVAAVKEVAAEVVAVVKEVAVVAPIAAAVALATPVEAVPVAPVEDAVEAEAIAFVRSLNSTTAPVPAGNLGGLIKQVLNHAPAASSLPPATPVPANTYKAAGFPAPATVDKYQQLYSVLSSKWQLAGWQVSIVKEYVAADTMKFEKVRDVIRIINYSNMNSINNLGAFVWSSLLKAIPHINILKHVKYSNN